MQECLIESAGVSVFNTATWLISINGVRLSESPQSSQNISLTPGVHGHKAPVIKSLLGVVIVTCRQHFVLCSWRRHQKNTDVTAPTVNEADGQHYMLKFVYLGHSSRARFGGYRQLQRASRRNVPGKYTRPIMHDYMNWRIWRRKHFHKKFGEGGGEGVVREGGGGGKEGTYTRQEFLSPALISKEIEG